MKPSAPQVFPYMDYRLLVRTCSITWVERNGTKLNGDPAELEHVTQDINLARLVCFRPTDSNPKQKSLALTAGDFPLKTPAIGRFEAAHNTQEGREIQAATQYKLMNNKLLESSP